MQTHRAPVDVINFYIREFIPNWYVCVEGPTPFGSLEPVTIAMNDLVVGTREEAVEHLHDHLQHLCTMWAREYDEDEWEITHCRINNGN